MPILAAKSKADYSRIEHFVGRFAKNADEKQSQFRTFRPEFFGCVGYLGKHALSRVRMVDRDEKRLISGITC